MSREDRAKQFAPFDALKGLRDALRLKEYEHERVQKGEIQEEKANEISKTLLSLENGNEATVLYYENGHYLEKTGKVKLIVEEGVLQIDNKKIPIDDLYDIQKK